VHNARYVTLFESALTAYWERLGWAFNPSAPHFPDVFFVVREFTITYQRPITATGSVNVQLWLDAVGMSSAVYGFRIMSEDGSVVHAEGRRVQVKLDPATLRPSPISDAVYEACRPLFADPALERAAS
jgi:acyl-CoA thioester hydrolase